MKNEKYEDLTEMVKAHKRGEPIGIYAVCSAHPFVIEASALQALEDSSLLLVESTSNQVDQYGGYMGMTPQQFARYVREICARVGLPADRIILGGDHLGPNVWQKEIAESAMGKAKRLVQECVQAGYRKIHLDASMKCGDDDPHAPLPPELNAERSAALCQAAEQACQQLDPGEAKPCYIIGSEVPLPGGAQEKENRVNVTRVLDAELTLNLTRQAFLRAGLEDAWERVIGLVVQPGVEFGDDFVLDYDKQAAALLSQFIEAYPHLLFEAHSTDYQRGSALKEMVNDHFAILKVGPGLTFAFREAVFALAWIEQEWLGNRADVSLSHIIHQMEAVMIADPSRWKQHYAGTEDEMRFARKFSYSDRVRYYWQNPILHQAINTMITNLSQDPIPGMLLSQFLPVQYNRIRDGLLSPAPRSIIYDKIKSVLANYAYACRLGGEQ